MSQSRFDVLRNVKLANTESVHFWTPSVHLSNGSYSLIFWQYNFWNYQKPTALGFNSRKVREKVHRQCVNELVTYSASILHIPAQVCEPLSTASRMTPCGKLNNRFKEPWRGHTPSDGLQINALLQMRRVKSTRLAKTPCRRGRS